MVKSGTVGEAAAKRGLEGSVKLLYHPIALQMIGSGMVEGDSKRRSHAGPDSGGKLKSVVRCQVMRNVEPGHPVEEESICTVHGGGQLHGDYLRPSGLSVSDIGKKRDSTRNR